MYDLKNIPQAIVFVVVVQEGSFSSAARRLELSKSVVSTHVRNLEDALGVRLLERTTRSLHMTSAGRQFHEYAKRMLSAWLDGREHARNHADTPRGKLRLSTSEALGRHLVVPTLLRYRALFPGVEVDLLYTDEMVSLVGTEIDIAIRGGTGTLQDSSLVARPLVRGHEVIVAHHEVASAWKDAQIPTHLSLAPWIAHSSRSNLCRWTFNHEDGSTCKLSVEPQISVSTATGLLELVVNGLGFAVMPNAMALQSIQEGVVVRLLPDWYANVVTLYAVYTSRRNPPLKTTRFLELLLEECNKRVALHVDDEDVGGAGPFPV